jgi:TetR/AcrR family transcriptional regulator, lmrAB and yxaGH operons repressor
MIAVMPPRLVSEGDLMDRLTTTFRRNGFAAATMVDIAAATGLQKSSLYHRFPGGKQQMAAEVATAAGAQFAADILAPIGSGIPLRDRVVAVGANLNRFYDQGRLNCLLDVLSVGEPGDLASDSLQLAANGWIDAFASVARSSGADGAAAVQRAQDAIAAIEGGLVLARVLGDNRAFLRAIERLPDTLLGDA